jgi:DNA (cytosine-5)-methyltransferase 1
MSAQPLGRNVASEGLRLAEFFAGIGLVRLALETYGFQTVFANDISLDKFEIYRQNFESSRFVVADINRIRSSDIPDCDLATACFPCTDISLAGERDGLSGSESGTFWSFIKILKGKQRKPRVLLIENVEGLLSSNGGRDFRSVIRALNDIGYACDPYLVDASYFVPQSRKRILIVGARQDLVGRSNAAPHSFWARPVSLIKSVHENADLDWFFRDIKPAAPNRESTLADVIEDLPLESRSWWPEEKTMKLRNQMDPRHRKLVDWAMTRTTPSCFCVYRRTRSNGPRAEVRADGLAGCLRTARGGSSRQILLCACKGSLNARFMTPREYARLQGVPEAYKLPSGDSKALFGLGDAVCVPVIQWIAKNCIIPLLSRDAERGSNARSETRSPTTRKLSSLSASA